MAAARAARRPTVPRARWTRRQQHDGRRRSTGGCSGGFASRSRTRRSRQRREGMGRGRTCSTTWSARALGCEGRASRVLQCWSAIAAILLESGRRTRSRGSRPAVDKRRAGRTTAMCTKTRSTDLTPSGMAGGQQAGAGAASHRVTAARATGDHEMTEQRTAVCCGDQMTVAAAPPPTQQADGAVSGMRGEGEDGAAAGRVSGLAIAATPREETEAAASEAEATTERTTEAGRGSIPQQQRRAGRAGGTSALRAWAGEAEREADGTAAAAAAGASTEEAEMSGAEEAEKAAARGLEAAVDAEAAAGRRGSGLPGSPLEATRLPLPLAHSTISCSRRVGPLLAAETATAAAAAHSLPR